LSKLGNKPVLYFNGGARSRRGDALVVINADLQDPPELIPDRAKHWQDGYDVVYARHISAATFIYAAIILYKALAFWESGPWLPINDGRDAFSCRCPALEHWCDWRIPRKDVE